MNYNKHYELLIKKHGLAKRPSTGYYERHHIMMRSHGGSDDDDNLVWLTAKAHYLAHFLLWKIFRDKSSSFAFHQMTITSYDRPRVYSGKVYENCRKDMAAALSKNNPMFDPEIVKKISGDNHFMKNELVRQEYSINRKGEGNPCFGKRGPRNSRLMTPAGEFKSITEAAKHFNIDPNTVYRRLRQDSENWYKLLA